MHEVFESELRIPLADGKGIYGTLQEVKGAPVVVLAHGLTAFITEHPYEFAARYFVNQGFTVYRPKFYSSPPDARSTLDVSLDDHINDLDTVVRFFKDRGHSVSVVGHSFGGLAALCTREQAFDTLVTWEASDPALTSIKRWPDLWAWEPKLECWRLRNGIECLISADLVDSVAKADVRAAIANLDVPVKFIAAGESGLAAATREFFEIAKGPKDFTVIDGADHAFTKSKCTDTLISETLSWIEKFGRDSLVHL